MGHGSAMSHFFNSNAKPDFSISFTCRLVAVYLARMRSESNGWALILRGAEGNPVAAEDIAQETLHSTPQCHSAQPNQRLISYLELRPNLVQNVKRKFCEKWVENIQVFQW